MALRHMIMETKGDGCISRHLARSPGSAAANDTSNHLLQATNASQERLRRVRERVSACVSAGVCW